MSFYICAAPQVIMIGSQPPEFRAEHDRLRLVIDPLTGRSIADIFGEPRGSGFSVSPSGGHTFTFWGGSICSFDHTGRFPLVFLYGPIYDFHRRLGGSESGFGRPLTSVVDLADASKCCIFEGGHIHSLGDKAGPYVSSRYFFNVRVSLLK
jgi:hypothetical protein